MKVVLFYGVSQTCRCVYIAPAYPICMCVTHRASNSSNGSTNTIWVLPNISVLPHSHTLIIPSPFPYLPSQLAARNGQPDVIRLLVEKGGADVQERNATTGWVALHEAAFRGHIECVKVSLLLAKMLLLLT